MTEEQLSALLRLKRHEQPPPGYYDQLLRDIHRRQRAELLRRPLWSIALERIQTFFGEHSMSHGSYAGALASVLIAGVAAIAYFAPAVKDGPSGATLAATRAAVEAPSPSVLSLQQVPPPSGAVFEMPATFQAAQTAYKNPATHQPRYIIDARPVSYEPSFSF